MLELRINGITEYVHEADKEGAMRRYWEARQRGDATATLRTVEIRPGEVSNLAKARIEEQQCWLDEAGFKVPPPIYAPGARVLDIGDDNFRTERRQVASMPKFPDAAATVIEKVTREDRRDITTAASGVQMRDNGQLLVNGELLELERGAFGQLTQRGGFGAGHRYLTEQCEPDLRAHNVNRQLRKAGDQLLTLRTRGRDARSVYATVTPAYTPVDTHQVLEVVTDGLQDARTEMVYDGSGVKATALWMPDNIVDLAAGDIFKVGVRVQSDDTARGRIRVSGVVWRNRCLNLIIIGEGEVETVSLVHRGDPERMLELIALGVDQARSSVGNFLDAWGHARKMKVAPRETITDWVESRRIQVPGVRSEAQRDALVQTLLDSWAKEEGDSLADAVNAVTRAAHENPLWGVNIREELERQASKLVYLAA